MKNEKVNRYTLLLREDVDAKAEEIMKWEDILKAEVFRRALLYYHFLVRSVIEENKTIVLVDKETNESQRLILPAELMERRQQSGSATKKRQPANSTRESSIKANNQVSV
jgi:hypothetical protein